MSDMRLRNERTSLEILKHGAMAGWSTGQLRQHAWLIHRAPRPPLAHLVGASKNSVPLMITRWAGVLTPQARVEVATSTCAAGNTVSIG